MALCKKGTCLEKTISFVTVCQIGTLFICLYDMLFLICVAFIKNSKLQYSDNMFPIYKILNCPFEKIHYTFLLYFSKGELHRKWIILLNLFLWSLPEKRNSSKIPFQKSSTVSPQEKYSFFSTKHV